LATGIDSINVVFGEMTQGNNKGYWISLYSNKTLKSFTTVSLEKNESSEILSKKIDIEYDNSSKRISLQVKHNPSSDEVTYTWLDNNEKSKTLKIANIERPIQKNKQFPTVKLESLNGESISVQDFEGKYVIINWWATTCAPCRKEIPGLNKLVEKYKTNKDVVFLSIAFDKKERLENYLKYNEFKYLQTLGDKKTSEIFGETFPKNIIVNSEGIVTYYSEGGHENKHIEIEEELKRQMNNK
jgi:thiol-disulfide isomerase/thioredoxin